MAATDAEGESIENHLIGGTGLTGLGVGRSDGDFWERMNRRVRDVGARLEKLVNFGGGGMAEFEFAPEEVVSIPQALEKGGQKGGEGGGIAQEEIVEFLDIHEVKAGGFENSSGGRTRFVVQEGHFTENVAWQEVADRDIPLSAHMDRDLDPALENTECFTPLISFPKNQLSFGK